MNANNSCAKIHFTLANISAMTKNNDIKQHTVYCFISNTSFKDIPYIKGEMNKSRQLL